MEIVFENGKRLSFHDDQIFYGNSSAKALRCKPADRQLGFSVFYIDNDTIKEGYIREANHYKGGWKNENGDEYTTIEITHSCVNLWGENSDSIPTASIAIFSYMKARVIGRNKKLAFLDEEMPWKDVEIIFENGNKLFFHDNKIYYLNSIFAIDPNSNEYFFVDEDKIEKGAFIPSA